MQKGPGIRARPAGTGLELIERHRITRCKGGMMVDVVMEATATDDR